MHIAHILLAGDIQAALTAQLTERGYTVIAVPSIEAMLTIDTSVELMIIDQDLAVDSSFGSLERLYFLNSNAATAVLIKNPEKLSARLKELISNGTLDYLFALDIESGLASSRIDRMFLYSQLSRSLSVNQQSLGEKKILEQELSIRSRILEHERELSAKIIESVTSGLVILDISGTIVLFNEHAAKMIDCSEARYVGLHYADIFPPKMHELIDALLGCVKTEPFRHESRKFRHGVRVLEVTGFLMIDNGQKPTGIMLFMHDVTEQENITIQLYRAEKLATIGTMLTGIAHELRNPLSIISARAQRALIKKDLDHDTMIKSFESIEAQVQRCASIVNNLLDFMRNTATKSGYHPIGELIDEALGYVQYQNSFDNIEVQKDFNPHLLLFGDRSRVVQAFFNIISNAADAMEGKGCLIIRAIPCKQNAVCIEFCDTGPGIDESIRRKIFDPFFTTKVEGKGTGLGLAIVNKIVLESGGEIWVESQPGETIFFVKLPSVKEPVNE